MELHQKFVDISMNNYIPSLLKKYQHPTPKSPVYSPYQYSPPQYGSKTQYAPELDPSTLLEKKTKHVQGIIGSLLHYARAVDPTILVALNELSTQQASPTVKSLKRLNHLLDYVATSPNTILRFHTSDMVLHMDSDAAYLAMPKARSRIAGHYYLSGHPFHIPVDGQRKPNAPILTECCTLRYVVTSAAEAETGGIFITREPPSPFVKPLLRSTIHNQQLPSKPITPQRKILLQKIHNKRNPSHGTCAFIGYEIVKPNNISKYFGKVEKPIGQIISQNITPSNITK